jgi:hypothetical protein
MMQQVISHKFFDIGSRPKNLGDPAFPQLVSVDQDQRAPSADR